ncbi:MAG: hypothetical protein AAFZ18_01575 [Myxococcota bacterium]
MRPRRLRRGFSNVVVGLLMGMLSVSALVVLGELQSDSRVYGEERRRKEARELAEGGAMEVLNSQGLMAQLPSTPGDNAKLTFGRPGKSEFWQDDDSRKYLAKVTLVRSAPALESSQRRVRAVVYEVKVRGKLSSGESHDMEALVFRLGVAPNTRASAEVFGK